MVQYGRRLAIAALIVAQPVLGNTQQSMAQPIQVCGGYFPNGNAMKIPIGTFQAFGLARARYDWILDKIEKIYAPKVAALGGRFAVNRMWTTSEVNASADRFGNTYNINMYGGLARHPQITEEGFVLVACHETGHHLGGAPKIAGDWATNEGGSDYYSTLKCIRWFYEGEDNETWAKTASIDSYAMGRCKSQFKNRDEQLYCMRAAAGAQSIAATFADLDGVPNSYRFDTPDNHIVARTDDNHPDTQCRLDTLFNAATCTASVNASLSDSDPKAGACTQGLDTFGWRPLCWFKP